MSINILPEEIINQIAAGEVIENPSSVIKELIENSIDAGSTKIECLLEDSGFSKIIIVDNGIGMSKEDLSKSIIRHATSKIKSFEDLYKIKSMGFRGEALASIKSVSKLNIFTRVKDSKVGFHLDMDGRICEISGISQGTKIIVEDLFYNTPARKKYLKSQRLELKSIVDIFQRFMISYPKIKFILKNNNDVIFSKPSFDLFIDNIKFIFLKEVKNSLIEFENNINGIKIFGVIANPSELTYSYKKNQFIFVNNRFINSKIISDAVYGGFDSNLMVNRHPFFVIFIDIDPEIIDVNVHPRKTEIKFENEAEIYSFVRNTILDIFKNNILFKNFEGDINKEKQLSLNEVNEVADEIIESDDLNSLNLKSRRDNPKKNYFSKDFQDSFSVSEGRVEYRSRDDFDSSNNMDLNNNPDLDFKSFKGPLFDELKEFRVIGQLNKTFILIQTKDDFILVDQHIAEEKYFYEHFRYYKKNNIGKQRLLKPVLINLDLQERCLFDENREVLGDLGFEVEDFGKDSILVRSIPLIFRNKENSANNFKEILHDIVSDKSIKCVEEEKHSKIASMACRMAIMAGEELTIPQMNRMVENLRYLRQPFNCPHGRPTFLKYSIKDLERKFKRII